MTHLSDTARQTPAGALPTSMRAVTRRRYGGPEVVGVETLERPEPAAGELLLRVRAAGLDRATLHLLEGKPYLARLAFGLRRPGRPVLGQQVAGEVVAVGADVSGYAVGDRVFGTADGSFAEYAVAKVSKVAATPDTVRDVDAATLGVSGTTALDAVNHVEVAAGQKVLVLGASGAVGTLVVQLAVHRGAEVTAVCSAAKLDLVRGLGAAHAADYRTTQITDLGGPFDAVIDIAGNRKVSQLRSVLTPTGALVIIGGEEGGPMLGGIQRNLVAALADRFTQQRLGWLFASTTTAGCAQLGELVASGALRPPVDRQVGLDGAAAGLEAMRRGELRGHVVICP